MSSEIDSSTPHNELKNIPQEITELDEQKFLKVIKIELTEEQKQRILNPPNVFPQQKSVVALHWHPEFVGMDLIENRINTLFPNRQEELIIPTQHNVLMSYGNYAGVEIDCCSTEFNRKVQFLLHFEKSKVQNATALESMLAHTYKYRSGQLFEFIETILNPKFDDRLQEAAEQTGVDEALVRFVKIYTKKINEMIQKHEAIMPPEMIRNKILPNYFETLRDTYGSNNITRAKNFLKAVKKIVKRYFSLQYFYRAQEVIEEVRSLGGAVIIPHPEQFWPILLADYDVDAYEVWNPQSREYTEFLINVVIRRNKKGSEKTILISMGDDCHMGEKVKDPKHQNKEKASREIGVQHAWEDMIISRILNRVGVSRSTLIQDYKDRLAG